MPMGSARSVLLTVFGDVVVPSGGSAWLGALSDLLERLDVPPATTRQALRRLAADGLVTSERHGRLSAYRVPQTAMPRMTEAAQRIYRRRPPEWDGRWRLLTSTFEESRRSARDALRRELGWLGYGSLGTASYACPWDHGERLAAVLAKHGVHGSVDTFTAEHDGDDRELAARLYDLDALAGLHQAFVARFGSGAVDGDGPLAALEARIELVHAWRRTLFLDPGLPTELVPDDWRGEDAVTLFASVYGAIEQPAWDAWAALTAAHDPSGNPARPEHATALRG
jgi:phenylacetic acid degradation operon negative regulatory protein